MYVPINIRSIKVDFDDILSNVENNRSVRAEAKAFAIQEIEKFVLDAKEELKIEVANHPVTKELENGEEEGSKLVGGGATLYSYVGFEKGSDQAGEILPFLEDSIRVKRESVRKNQGRLSWAIPIQVPELEDFDTAGIAEIPWLIGKSFVSQIEAGIPGMAQFIYFKRPLDSENSRSRRGIQSKNDVEKQASSVEDVSAKYMGPLLEKFINDIR